MPREQHQAKLFRWMRTAQQLEQMKSQGVVQDVLGSATAASNDRHTKLIHARMQRSRAIRARPPWLSCSELVCLRRCAGGQSRASKSGHAW